MAKLNDSPCHYCNKKMLGCRIECKDWPIYVAGQKKLRADRLREANINHAVAANMRKKAKRHTNKWK